MKYHNKNCQRCNKKYAGTASSKYCIICTDIVRSERISANNKKLKEKAK